MGDLSIQRWQFDPALGSTIDTTANLVARNGSIIRSNVVDHTFESTLSPLIYAAGDVLREDVG